MLKFKSSRPSAADSVPGLYIPGYILVHDGLSSNERLLLAQIVQLTKTPRGCFASQQFLGDQVSLHRATVARLLAGLVQKGFVLRSGSTLSVPLPSDPIWTRNATQNVASCSSVAGDEQGDPLSNCDTGCRKPRLADVATCDVVRRKPRQPSEGEVNKKLKLDKNLSGEASLAGRAGNCKTQKPEPQNQLPLNPLSPSAPEKPPSGTRRTSPVEEKLLEVCGLAPLVGTKAFPGSRFGKTLSVLRDLKATPEELDRFAAWWRDQAMSYKRAFPTLEQVAGHFHESRSCGGRSGAGRRTPLAPGELTEDDYPDLTHLADDDADPWQLSSSAPKR